MEKRTLKQIAEINPYPNKLMGLSKLLKHFGKTDADDTEVSLEEVLKYVGVEYALWCVCLYPEHDKEWRRFAIFRERLAQKIIGNEKALRALDIAEKRLNGEGTKEELDAAWAEVDAEQTFEMAIERSAVLQMTKPEQIKEFRRILRSLR